MKRPPENGKMRFMIKSYFDLSPESLKKIKIVGRSPDFPNFDTFPFRFSEQWSCSSKTKQCFVGLQLRGQLWI
jgi:hypothetical protein